MTRMAGEQKGMKAAPDATQMSDDEGAVVVRAKPRRGRRARASRAAATPDSSPRLPPSAPVPSPAAAAAAPAKAWACAFACGFRGSHETTTSHEASCARAVHRLTVPEHAVYTNSVALRGAAASAANGLKLSLARDLGAVARSAFEATELVQSAGRETRESASTLQRLTVSLDAAGTTLAGLLAQAEAAEAAEAAAAAVS